MIAALYGELNMSTFLEFISNNGLLSSLVAATIIGLIGWLYQQHRNSRDSKAILSFLAKSAVETTHTFRSTEAIASNTKLTEERVSSLCAKHSKIRRNTKEKQTWSLN